MQESQEEQVHEPYAVAKKKSHSRPVPNQVCRTHEQLCDCQRKDDRDHSDDKLEQTQPLSHSLCGAKSRSQITAGEARAVELFGSVAVILAQNAWAAAFGQKQLLASQVFATADNEIETPKYCAAKYQEHR